MRILNSIAPSEAEVSDGRALRLMLVYIAAECRRIGAADAAQLAIEAADLIPEGPQALRDAAH
ncbi:hypothetical protein IAI18_06780 [Acetobacteraceae bacterium H6797]|nr:hypothetical protein [Acetobacteraceae bacterium H6797]